MTTSVPVPSSPRLKANAARRVWYFDVTMITRRQ